MHPTPVFVYPASRLPVYPSKEPARDPLTFPFAGKCSTVDLSVAKMFTETATLPSILSLGPCPSGVVGAINFLLVSVSPLRWSYLFFGSALCYADFDAVLRIETLIGCV